LTLAKPFLYQFHKAVFVFLFTTPVVIIGLYEVFDKGFRFIERVLRIDLRDYAVQVFAAAPEKVLFECNTVVQSK
jgi:hypothetical protein